MKNFIIVMCIVLTPLIWAKEQGETFVCITELGEYEYKVSAEAGKKVALNSEEDTVVLIETGYTSRDRQESSKRIKALESLCGTYTNQELPTAEIGQRIETVYFGLNLFKLSTSEQQQLSKLMSTFRRPLPRLLVEGHTDSSGSNAVNKALALKRANVVKDYLVASGYKSEFITASSVGQSSPKYSNETKDGRQKNRRVEIRRLK